jgi:hypothetical protein
MPQENQPDSSGAGAVDNYLLQSRAFVREYLEQHGLTVEMVHEMPEEKAHAILKQALNYAADQIARHDLIIHLGQLEEEPKAETQPHRHHTDRLPHYHSGANPKQ